MMVPMHSLSGKMTSYCTIDFRCNTWIIVVVQWGYGTATPSLLSGLHSKQRNIMPNNIHSLKAQASSRRKGNAKLGGIDEQQTSFISSNDYHATFPARHVLTKMKAHDIRVICLVVAFVICICEIALPRMVRTRTATKNWWWWSVSHVNPAMLVCLRQTINSIPRVHVKSCIYTHT